MTAPAALERIREICLALPETTERVSHGAPCFFVRGKTTFVMFLDNHHGDRRLAIWCAAPDGMQRDLIAGDPERFFRPPYVGHRGWIGVRLDIRPDWRQIASLVSDAYRIVAPRKLVLSLASSSPGTKVNPATPTSDPASSGRPAKRRPAVGHGEATEA